MPLACGHERVHGLLFKNCRRALQITLWVLRDAQNSFIYTFTIKSIYFTFKYNHISHLS